MKQKIDTVIFDLDGTLLNTLEDLSDSVNYIMDRYGFPRHTMNEVREMVGSGITVLLERAIPFGRKNPHFDDCVLNFQNYYSAHMRCKTAPFPGIMDLLEKCRNEGLKLAVVSNKYDSAVKSLCRDFFCGLVTTAIGESKEIARKPAPDTVFLAMKELGSTPGTCVYVGDSEVDIATAENAGIDCISVCWGFKDRHFLKQHGAHTLVDTTMELWESICKSVRTPD